MLSPKAVALRRVTKARDELVVAREKYEGAMLSAVESGVNFTELAQAIHTSEPAARGFVRRAQKRRSKQ